MRRIIFLFALIATALLLWTCLSLPATAAAGQGASISGKVFVNTGNQNIPNGTNVSLVNGSNRSEYIPGFNTTPDQSGFFQFMNVSPGNYSVYAWSPYYTEGYSAGIDVTSNGTYTASVVLLAMPYYANITANTQHVTYGGQADITIQAADYWGRPVSNGWQVLLRTTVGVMEPDSAFTDTNGKVYSKIAWVNNSTPAEITAFAIATNGSSYGLEENLLAAPTTSTPTPTVSASATPAASPTVAANATATAIPGPTTTVGPTPTATPIPTPGFELIAVLAALGLALSIRKDR